MATNQLATRVSRLAKRNPGGPKDIELWAYANLDLRVGTESIRKALAGQVDPTQCAVELLLALAGYYGVGPEALGHFAEARLRPVIAFAGSMTPPDTPDGQVIDASGWFGQTARRPLAATGS